MSMEVYVLDREIISSSSSSSSDVEILHVASLFFPHSFLIDYILLPPLLPFYHDFHSPSRSCDSSHRYRRDDFRASFLTIRSVNSGMMR